jgi:hypothetical protein
VRDVAVDHDDAAIVSTIIRMAHSLKLEVVAEGVESRQQLEFLREHGCDYVQGHLFADPMTREEYRDLLLAEQFGDEPTSGVVRLMRRPFAVSGARWRRRAVRTSPIVRPDCAVDAPWRHRGIVRVAARWGNQEQYENAPVSLHSHVRVDRR